MQFVSQISLEHYSYDIYRIRYSVHIYTVDQKKKCTHIHNIFLMSWQTFLDDRTIKFGIFRKLISTLYKKIFSNLFSFEWFDNLYNTWPEKKKITGKVTHNSVPTYATQRTRKLVFTKVTRVLSFDPYLTGSRYKKQLGTTTPVSMNLI